MLSRLTGKMAEDLRSEGEVALGRVGRLVADEEGFISFDPRRSKLDSDILADVRLVAKSRQAAVEEKKGEEPKGEAAVAAASEESRDRRVVRVSPDRYVFTVSKRAVHVAAMLVMIFSACISLLIPITPDNEQKASVVPIDDFLRSPLVIEVEDRDKASESAADSISTLSQEDSIVIPEITLE